MKTQAFPTNLALTILILSMCSCAGFGDYLNTEQGQQDLDAAINAVDQVGNFIPIPGASMAGELLLVVLTVLGVRKGYGKLIASQPGSLLGKEVAKK